jgi:iron complex transport system ATP-binding protein
MHNITLYTHNLRLEVANKILCAHLNLRIKPGEVWGVLGPNGCGKSTLLHTLAGLSAPKQGRILLNDLCLQDFALKSLAQCIGILFQEIHCTFSQTVWDYCLAARYPYLSYLKKVTHDDLHIAQSALEQMELTSLSQQSITQLSGGEKRRLAIAALLTQTPSIYLLDEPTNHLDLRHQIQVLNTLQKLAKTTGAAVLMSLHDINLAQRFCDHILLMYANGHTLQGTTSQILNATHLTQLYQHPIVCINHGDFIYFSH